MTNLIGLTEDSLNPYNLCIHIRRKDCISLQLIKVLLFLTRRFFPTYFYVNTWFGNYIVRAITTWTKLHESAIPGNAAIMTKQDPLSFSKDKSFPWHHFDSLNIDLRRYIIDHESNSSFLWFICKDSLTSPIVSHSSNDITLVEWIARETPHPTQSD
jgi:hypothetical protein